MCLQPSSEVVSGGSARFRDTRSLLRGVYRCLRLPQQFVVLVLEAREPLLQGQVLALEDVEPGRPLKARKLLLEFDGAPPALFIHHLLGIPPQAGVLALELGKLGFQFGVLPHEEVDSCRSGFRLLPVTFGASAGLCLHGLVRGKARGDVCPSRTCIVERTCLRIVPCFAVAL